MPASLRGWSLLENGGALYGDAEADEVVIYGADGTRAGSIVRPSEADLRVAEAWAASRRATGWTPETLGESVCPCHNVRRCAWAVGCTRDCNHLVTCGAGEP